MTKFIMLAGGYISTKKISTIIPITFAPIVPVYLYEYYKVTI